MRTELMFVGSPSNMEIQDVCKGWH